MRWINHKLTALCITVAATGNPVLGVMATITSTLPDSSEFIPFPGIKHRGLSHDIMLWGPILLALLITAFVPDNIFSFPPHILSIFRIVALGTTMGVVIHLLTDSLSKGGVPVFGKYHLAADFYKTFTPSEYLVSLAICLPCIVIGLVLGRIIPQWDQLARYINF